MAYVLHPTNFRQIANYAPGPLQSAGGITCETILLVHHYANFVAGMDQGCAAMVLMAEAPTGWIQFDDTVHGGPEEWYTYFRLEGGRQYVLRCAQSRESFGSMRNGGTHRLTLGWDDNVIGRTLEQEAQMHVDVGRELGQLLGKRLLQWMVPQPLEAC